MHDAIYYIAMALCVLAFGGLFYFINRSNSMKNSGVLQDILKKYRVFVIAIPIVFLIGFTLFNVAFFVDEATLSLLTKYEISVKGVHKFFVYFFGGFFSLLLFSGIYSFYFFFYFPDVEKKLHTIFKYTLIGSIALGVVSYIVYLEGMAPYFSYPLANTLHIGKGGIILIRSNSDLASSGLNIALYAIFILSGAVLVLFICDHFVYQKYGEHGLLYTCFIIAFPSGIIGARAWYVCIDLFDNGASSSFAKDWTEIFRIRDGGLAIMGGAIFGIIAGVTTMLVLKYGLKRKSYKNMNYLNLCDIVVPTILIAQAIGRWGNFFNNEVNGYAIEMKYFSYLPTVIKNNMQYADHGSSFAGEGNMYVPLFLIEGVTNLIGYYVLYYGFGRGFFSKWFIKFVNLFSSDKENKIIKAESFHADGTLIGGYLLWYGLTRTILEPLRTTSDYYASSIVTSYVMIGGGIAIIIFFILYKILYTDKKEKKPAEVK